MEKMYWFSTKKHAHDIEYRRNRCFNEVGQLEYENKPVPKELRKLLEDLEEIRGYLAGMGNYPVQLPARLYGVAMDAVGWAAAARGCGGGGSYEKKVISRSQWESAMFNLDSMRGHFLYEIDLILAGKSDENQDDAKMLKEYHEKVEEIENLISSLQSGRIKTSEWNRIQQIVKERQMMRYTTCLASGMDEATAAGAFQD